MKPYYQDAWVTIYHGDCREIVPELGRFDLLLTDPPYGIGALMQGGKNTGHWNRLSSGNAWDETVPELGFLWGVAQESIIWGGNYFPLPPSRCWLAWHKLNAVPTQADMELAWTTLDRPAKLFSFPSGGALKRNGHPTEKPLELISWCLAVAGSHIQSVVDPFAGSGTTGRACKDRLISCTLIEREESYCEIAARRMAQEVFDFSPP